MKKLVVLLSAIGFSAIVLAGSPPANHPTQGHGPTHKASSHPSDHSGVATPAKPAPATTADDTHKTKSSLTHDLGTGVDAATHPCKVHNPQTHKTKSHATRECQPSADHTGHKN